MKEIIKELIGDQSNPKKNMISKNRRVARFFDESLNKTVFEQFFPIDSTELIRIKNLNSGFDSYNIQFESYSEYHGINLTEEWIDDSTNEIMKSSIKISLPKMNDLNLNRHIKEDKKKYRDYIFLKMKEISELSIDDIENLWFKQVGEAIKYIDISLFLKKEKIEKSIWVMVRNDYDKIKEIETLRKNIRETGSVFTALSKCPSYCYINGGQIPSNIKKGRTITKSVSYFNCNNDFFDNNNNGFYFLPQYFIMHKVFNCLPVEGSEYQLMVDVNRAIKDPNFNWKDKDNIYNKIWGSVNPPAEGLTFCGFIKKFTDTKFVCLFGYKYSEPNNILSDGRIESHVAQLINDISDDENK